MFSLKIETLIVMELNCQFKKQYSLELRYLFKGKGSPLSLNSNHKRLHWKNVLALFIILLK